MKITTRGVGDGLCVQEHPLTIVPTHFFKLIQYHNPKRQSKILVYKFDLKLKTYVLHETVTDKERIETIGVIPYTFG